MREYFNELVFWFFLAIGFFFIIKAVSAFAKVAAPMLPLPNGLKEAFT